MRERLTDLWRALAVLSCSAILILGCDVQHNAPLAPSVAVLDGFQASNPHFAFLPPLAPPPEITGVFDATAQPLVIVCEWDGNQCALPPIATFSLTSGTDDEQISVSPDAERYMVLWRAPSSLESGRVYRIRVLVAGTELGSVDVIATDTEADENSDMPHVRPGRTLPIRFRIEQGALQTASFAGVWMGSLSGVGSLGSILEDDWVFELTQDGTAVSGLVSSAFSGLSAPLTGTASGNVLNYSFTVVSACCSMAYQGTGTLVDAGTMSMSGTMSASWGETFTWTGTYTRAADLAAARAAPALAPSQSTSAQGKGLVRGGIIARPPSE
ncbi:MAG TPA: hypothetical protein VGU74_05815 [Gemmatimonadales bacterium]|nr:hypothetical protein [Gemmatimonadales bacterium]